MLAVAKFGGTSVATAKNIFNCLNIVLNNPKVRVVVVSAFAKTTDRLLAIHALITQHDLAGALRIYQDIKWHHLKVATDLAATAEMMQEISAQLTGLETTITWLAQQWQAETMVPNSSCHLLHFGEKLSSQIFAYAIELYHGGTHRGLNFDATQVIQTERSYPAAALDDLATQKAIQSELAPLILADPKVIIVTQGFIGRASVDQSLTTLGRGGSDYTAAILAKYLNAQELAIWTDVPGVLTTDPKIVSNARQIKKMSYVEAAELAYFGAKVLHPLTLIPLLDTKIALFVGSTFDDEIDQGTWIYPELASNEGVKAIALRQNQSLVTFTKVKKLNSYGFLEKIFHLLTEHKVSVDHITTSEVSTSITIGNRQLLTGQLLHDLEQFAYVHIEEALSLISIIGENVTGNRQIHHDVFNALADVSIRAIYMGSQKNNISFLVAQQSDREIVQQLHRQLIERER